MADTRQAAKIYSVILDEYISTTQQVLSLFEAVSHHSLIEHVKISGFIFQSK